MSFRFPKDAFASREQLQPLAGIWLRKIFLEDWSTKLIALAITLLLWFGISGQQTPDTRSFSEVRINFRVSGDLEISNEPLRQVELTLTGDKGKLDRLYKRDMIVSADLSSYNQGERLVQLRPDNVTLELSSGDDLPAGIKIVDIQPNMVLLKLEPREEREVEVKAEFEGLVPDGIEIYETLVTPVKVRVRGPASFIRSLDTVSTETIPLEDRTGDFTARQVAINLLNPKITVLDTVVDVTVRMGPKRSDKIFNVRGITDDGGSETFSITVSGPLAELEKLNFADIRVALEKVSEDSIAPKITLPDDLSSVLTVKTIKPSVIKLK